MKKIIYALIGVFLLLNGCAMTNKDQSMRAPQQMKNPFQVKKSVRTPVQVKTANRTPDLAGGPENRVREPHPLSLADLRAKYASHFILHGPKNKRQVALTFDDGPDLVYTPQVLDVLKKHNVKATFFLIGNRAAKHPEMVKRIIREGHVIGNHT
jgi:peptidoglycan/xylan/chitin deacetylase (PgdA/CDA1 family)